jgi:uncharacterized membrane-anchored protein
MSSTFLTRLRVGSKLVDAKGVSRLYRSRISTMSLMMLCMAALVTIAVTVQVTPVGRAYFHAFGAQWDAFVYWLQGLFR